MLPRDGDMVYHYYVIRAVLAYGLHERNRRSTSGAVAGGSVLRRIRALITQTWRVQGTRC